MDSELKRAKKILKDDGVAKFSKRTIQYLHNYKSFHLAAYICQIDEYIQKRTLREIQVRMQAEEDLEDVLDTVLNVRPGYLNYRLLAAQLREEIAEFIKFVKKQSPESVVEIGTHHGGTLYLWSRCFDSLLELVSVDLPHFFDFVDAGRIELFREFAPSAEMYFIREDSHEQRVYEEVAAHVDEIDLLFVDGDHTYTGVKQDFKMYSDLVSDGGFVAFHDIVPHAESEAAAQQIVKEKDLDDRYVRSGPAKWNVHQFWTEISESYDSWEFRSHPQQMGKGIGVIQL